MRLLSSRDHALEKRRYVQELGAEGVFAIGNGNNDVGMLRAASVGVAVCLPEGCSREAAAAADILVTSPEDALDLLLHPMRLTATLRRWLSAGRGQAESSSSWISAASRTYFGQRVLKLRSRRAPTVPQVSRIPMPEPNAPPIRFPASLARPCRWPPRDGMSGYLAFSTG